MLKRSFLIRIVILHLLLCTGTSLARIVRPIFDISTENARGFMSSPPDYSWLYSYDIGFKNFEMNIELRILLTGDKASPSLKAEWETGIEDIWGHTFDIIDTTEGLAKNPYHYHINFDVIFSETNANAHSKVVVVEGQGRGDMMFWYTTCNWGDEYNGAFAAHEAGHMFGLYDEYDGDGAVDPVNPIIDYTSLMGSLLYPPKERHYQRFLDWLQLKAPTRALSLGEYNPYWDVPEPAMIILLGIGFVIARRKRQLISEA